MFNGEEVLKKLSLSVAVRPIYTLIIIYGRITHRFRDEVSWTGPLLICRDPLLHFTKEGHESTGGKVICLSSYGKLVPEPGLEPRPLDFSSRALSALLGRVHICGI